MFLVVYLVSFGSFRVTLFLWWWWREASSRREKKEEKIGRIHPRLRLTMILCSNTTFFLLVSYVRKAASPTLATKSKVCNAWRGKV